MSRRQELFQSCESYFEYFCVNSSCHAGNWFIKVKSPKCKKFLLFILFLMQAVLCLSVINTIFFNEDKYAKYCYDYDEEEVTRELPFVTVCNPRIFDREKTKGNG